MLAGLAFSASAGIASAQYWNGPPPPPPRYEHRVSVTATCGKAATGAALAAAGCGRPVIRLPSRPAGIGSAAIGN